MEQQTSLQRHHVPTPSQMILDAPKSCMTSLEYLQVALEKYKRVPSAGASTVMKLKVDLEFSSKPKDFAGFDIQMQREIEYLHTALGLNSTRIL
jgi:hypothetical protein